MNNTDGYGASIIQYAKRWSKLMEEEIDNGANLEDIADMTSHEADTDGITGVMYGASLKILFEGWKYGEDLRKWHNKM